MNEQETSMDIIAEMRIFKCRNLETGELELCNAIANYFADRLEAANKREVGALKQRCAELNAEIAAKDAVIMRLNDAIAEEQRRKMATPENSSVVGDAAKLREALGKIRAELWNNTVIAGKRKFELYEIADTALAAPPRNCDRFASAEEAWDAYDEWVDSYRLKGKTPPFNEFGWLFAPATEKEGGAK